MWRLLQKEAEVRPSRVGIFGAGAAVTSDFIEVMAERSGAIGFLLRLVVHNAMSMSVTADWSIHLPTGVAESTRRKVFRGRNEVASGRRVVVGTWRVSASSPAAFAEQEIHIKADIEVNANRFLHDEFWTTMERLVSAR